MKGALEGHARKPQSERREEPGEDVAQLHPARATARAKVTGKKATTQAKADSQQTP